jgi:chromate transporter
VTKHKTEVTYRYLIRLFLTAGSVAFGGWSTTSLYLEKELVDKRGILSHADVQGPVTYAQIIPGGTQTAIVSGVGYRLHGVIGSILATFFYLLPSITLITLFSVIYFQYLHNTNLMTHLNPIRAALGGIILSNAYKIGQRHTSHHLLWLLVGFAFLGKLIFGINSAFIIMVYAITGLGYSVLKLRRHAL